MKNFIFISPAFPDNYENFCTALKADGVNVLGIGDTPYDSLSPRLRGALTEYYRVEDMENYDAMFRAVAFLSFRHGTIDWLESNNEYWLMQDAQLREDFHITTGLMPKDMTLIKYKSKMKEYYQKAGIPTARYHLVDDLDGCRAFIEEVGYPVVAKPDNGVGASHTFKLQSDAELASFFEAMLPGVTYIMEEFIDGEVCSYDAVIDSNGEPMFETGNVTPYSIMDIVNQGGNLVYYIVKTLSPDVKDAGRRTVKSFGVKNRFIHFEFFRLLKAHKGLGKKGDVIALEVNMRPCGGFTPDMINFSHNTNIYKIWADMIAFDHSTIPAGKDCFCAYAGRRDGKDFALSHEEILEKYNGCLKMVDRIPDVLSGAMGNQMYVATFPSRTKMDAFYNDVLGYKKES